MDLLQHLPDGLVLQEIIPRLDPSSRVRAAAVSRLWRDLSRRAPPPADDGIPWMWLISDLELGNSLIQPPPCSLPNPHRPSSLTARMGAPLGSHGQYALFVPPQPPSTSMIGPLPRPCMLVYNPFQPSKSFRIPLINGFQPRQLAQLSCSPDSSTSHSNVEEGSFPPNCVVVAAQSSCVYIYHPYKHDWKRTLTMAALYDLIFHKGELYCIDRKREIKALNVQKYLSNNNVAMARRIVVPAREDAEPAMMGISNYPVINYYLVESSCTGGELLLVTRYDHGYRIVTCTVQRVEEGRLVEVDDLGDTMLFVREGCSISSRSCSRYCRSSSSEFFTNNSIYFIVLVWGNFLSAMDPILLLRFILYQSFLRFDLIGLVLPFLSIDQSMFFFFFCKIFIYFL